MDFPREMEYVPKSNNKILLNKSTFSQSFKRVTCGACQLRRDESGVEYLCVEWDEINELCEFQNSKIYGNLICNQELNECCCKVNFNAFL